MPKLSGESVGSLAPTVYRRHVFAATNPCHVYSLAKALFNLGYLADFHSGYPRWRLDPPLGFPLQTHSLRTLVTYGLQRLPQSFRPADDWVFRWQDVGFDRLAAADLSRGSIFHGIPGQCLECFRRARRLGHLTVLNHATGPIETQWELVRGEYERVGLLKDLRKLKDAFYWERIKEERALADVHCVASQVVKKQLVEVGVSAKRIAVVPYGADPAVFRKRQHLPEGPFRVCFVGRHSLRKGIRILLEALEQCGDTAWEAHFVGAALAETEPAFDAYAGRPVLIRHGTKSQSEVARLLRGMDVLVLPSAEEGFGLVVVQALNCGVPCIVSDRVGASDLIHDGENGSIHSFGDVTQLSDALMWWSSRRRTVPDTHSWFSAAIQLLESSREWRRQ